MEFFDDDFTRRNFLQGSGTALGGVALSMLPLQIAMAAAFPDRNIKVYVPTREGGGADRNLRAFTGVWKKYLGVNFEGAYYPGAAGRVGYEKYMGLAKPDCYDLLFGNMGPEVLNWVVKKPTFSLDDYFYFAQVDQDPAELFVSTKSKLKTIDDIIAEGKKRTLNVGVSRLAHPASLGALAVARHTGAKFNLIPLSGGKNTVAGAVTGEVDFSVLTSGTVAAKRKSIRTLLVFSDKNVLGEALDNAPTMNDHFGTKLPPMLSARAFAIHRAAMDKYPDRFKVLQDTFKQVFDDPTFKPAVLKARGYWEYVNYGGIEECGSYVKDILEIGARFKSLLSGKKS